jgi:hypothetical protein
MCTRAHVTPTHSHVLLHTHTQGGFVSYTCTYVSVLRSIVFPIPELKFMHILPSYMHRSYPGVLCTRHATYIVCLISFLGSHTHADMYALYTHTDILYIHIWSYTQRYVYIHCMHIQICIHTHTDMYAYIVYTYRYVYIHCIHIQICIHTHTDMYAYIVYTYRYVYIHRQICIHTLYTHIDMYTYTYRYAYTYTYRYVYTYTHRYVYIHCTDLAGILRTHEGRSRFIALSIYDMYTYIVHTCIYVHIHTQICIHTLYRSCRNTSYT